LTKILVVGFFQKIFTVFLAPLFSTKFWKMSTEEWTFLRFEYKLRSKLLGATQNGATHETARKYKNCSDTFMTLNFMPFLSCPVVGLESSQRSWLLSAFFS
jgi:hypothetical protein